MTKQALREMSGACHCGNVEYGLRWPEDSSVIGARHCGCSFCRVHGAAWTSSPLAELDISVRDANKVSVYRFGTATADFLVCSVCGVPTVVLGGSGETLHAVVNVNALDSGAFELEHSTTDFDGEEIEDRLARRRRNWIPNVTISGLSPSQLSQ